MVISKLESRHHNTKGERRCSSVKINTLSSRQIGPYFVDHMFGRIILNEQFYILIEIF